VCGFVADLRSRPTIPHTRQPVSAVNGLDQPSVVSCDNVQTIPVTAVGHQIDFLLASPEPALASAIGNAFDLEPVQR